MNEQSKRMAKPFRLAIVGSGQIAAQAHLPAALSSTRVQVAALVDPVLERARYLARRFGINPKIASNVREVLAETDGVVIATPNHTHCELAIECLKAGLPILVEKPLATSVQEGEQIVRLAEERRITAAVGYSTRFAESVRLMRSLLGSGYFGQVRRFMYQFGSTGEWSPLSAYTLDRRATGGGALVVTGTHFLDRMLYWFGYPDDCEYSDDSLGGPEANAFAAFRYFSETATFEGVVRFSKTVSLKTGFVMETETGRVILREGRQAPILFRPFAYSDLETVMQRRGSSLNPTRKTVFQLQLEDFVEACQEQREPVVSARQGLESLRLIEALYARRQQLKMDWYAPLQEVQAL